MYTGSTEAAALCTFSLRAPFGVVDVVPVSSCGAFRADFVTWTEPLCVESLVISASRKSAMSPGCKIGTVRI